MLSIAVRADGSVRISGETRELCDLAAWILLAIRDGAAAPAFAADAGLTAVEVVRDETG
jgi:hypothetical protein